MKNFLLFVLTILYSVSIQASHNAGGDIHYEYISSTGGTHKYKITLRLYRDNTGISLPSSANITACSASYGSVNAFLNEVGSTGGIGIAMPSYFDCVGSSNAGLTINVVKYEGEITLPGNAPDWTFTFQTCCRNQAVTNIINPSSQGFLIEAHLNNMYGQNNSPIFITEGARAFCIGNTFNWQHSTIEPDGDSLFYRMSNIKDGSCSSVINIPFVAYKSYNQPITTSPANSLSLNSLTGLMTFAPAAVEIDAMGIAVDEFRYVTSLSSWIKLER